MPDDLLYAVLVFIAAAGAIGVLGVRMTGDADTLADRTGLGEAVVGAALLGAATSLPGIVATVTAAVDGYPALAVSNALGGIAAQTAFLAVADLAYRRANLEHAAASLPNMLFGALLIALLSLLLLAMLTPDLAIAHIHPVTLILPFAYAGGLRWVRYASVQPMWLPRMTQATRPDRPDPEQTRTPLTPLVTRLALLGLGVAFAGWAVARAAEVIAGETGLSDSLVGGLLVAVSTSLPELVTTLAAVRRGALTLAVSGILGGNAFDTLFAAIADLSYTPGPIFGAVSPGEPVLAAVTVLMTSTLLLGLMHRERFGPANIGVESVLLILIYATGIALLR